MESSLSIKSSIYIIGLTKRSANQITKALSDSVSKNSFEIDQFTNVKDVLKNINVNPSILISEETEDEKSYNYFREIRIKFPKCKTILILFINLLSIKFFLKSFYAS